MLTATTIVWLLLCLRIRSNLSLGVWIGCYFTLISFHAAMLGFWVGFGRPRWRLAVATAVACLSGIISWLAWGMLFFWEFQVYTMGIFAVAAVTTFGLRLGKGTLRLISESEREQSNPIQFSIKRIMFWTAVIAVLQLVSRGVAKLVETHGRGPASAENLPMIASLAFFVGIATVVSIWALLQVQISLAQIFVAVVAIAVAAICLFLLYPGDAMFPITTVTSQLLIMIALLMLRIQGYRFVGKLGARI